MPPLVEVDRLTFRYRRATESALRDISLRIEPGQVLLVAGPSGCGKSTLIRALNGLIPHAYSGELSGAVRLVGKPTAAMKLKEISLLVGTVLQDPMRQVVGATVESEMAFGPENLGLPREEIRARVGEVSEQAGIGALRGRASDSLSGGELQLLAVAGILMMRPRLYVVDEPLANLDPVSAARLLDILRRLADDGCAVVMVEHRVEEALELRPDAVLYLDEGRTRYLGPVDGFLRVADPAAVKLPFEVVLGRALNRPAADPTLAPPAMSSGAATPPGAPPRLAFEDLSVALESRPVLHRITAAFGHTEVVAVLGANGSGKTTLFRTAMALVPPLAGRVLVDGLPATGRPVSDLARVFGYVFQSPSQMLFARTVREELLFGPRTLGLRIDDAEAAVAEALRRCRLDDEEGILRRPPLTLSFGQQKRLALAVALMLQPRTLILDEPSAGQDHRTAQAFLGEVATIAGIESLYLVTHDVDLALTHADRIILLREGRIVADGPPLAVAADAARWTACNLKRTSLMAANLAWRGSNQRFLEATELARRMAEEGAGRAAADALAGTE